MLLKLLFIFILVQKCVFANDWNDEDYDKMPPLYGMDSNYDSCLRKPGGVYCVAKFDLDGDSDNELIKMIREYSRHDINHFNYSYIERAVCVSRTCKKFIQDKSIDKVSDLNVALERCMSDIIWNEYGIKAKLVDIYYCDKHGDSKPVDVGDWILSAFLTIFVSLNIIGSIYDIWQSKNIRNGDSSGNPYILSFSLFRNWKQLTSINEDLQYERLKGIHGLKSIMTFFMVLAHAMWIVGNGFTDNPREFERAQNRFHYKMIFNGMVIVQTFFVISGCLLAFQLQMLSEIKPLKWNMLPKILFFRLVRLTPANAFTILFTATWLRHLGSGPLWKMYVMSSVNQCREHWWKHLLYFNNYVKEDRFCALHTWHLAAEFQLFTIGLIVYMITVSRGRFMTLAFFGLIGMVLPALQVWVQDLDALVIHRPEFYRTFKEDTFWSLYVPGHTNTSCHIIGMTVGLLSYYCIKNKIEYPNSKMLKLFTWCAPLGIVGIIFSGSLFYIDNERPHILIRTAYAAIQRPAFGVLISLMILNLVMKFESVIRGIMEWQIWIFTSRLCYSVYLLHLNVVFILLGSRTELTHIFFFYVVIHHFGIFFLTLAAAIPFYLILEAPVRSLMAAYLLEAREKKTK